MTRAGKLSLAAGVAAVLLFGLMVYLFASYPVINYEPDEQIGEVRAECGSVAGAGWPGRSAYLVDENGSGPVQDSIDGTTSGNLPPERTTSAIHRDCEHRRATYIGFMALLAVPTAVLAVVAVVMSPRRREVDSAAQHDGG